MADQSKVGTTWTEAELDAIVEDYFSMLRDEIQGVAYVKAHHAKALDKIIMRGRGSIERKHMNISAVLTELGLPTINGYKPNRNYQGAIFTAIDRYLDRHSDAWDLGLPNPISQTQGMEDVASGHFSSPWDDKVTVGTDQKHLGAGSAVKSSLGTGLLRLTDCPERAAPKKPRSLDLERMVRKFDPAGRDHRNRILGRLGEEMVMAHERHFLIAHGCPALAKKIEWTSDERGDGAGYDIKSFDPNGQERLIEVKTTRGGPKTDFFLTRTEVEVAQERPDAWRLYRVHDILTAPGLFQIKPPLAAAMNLQAETWRAYF